MTNKPKFILCYINPDLGRWSSMHDCMFMWLYQFTPTRPEKNTENKSILRVYCSKQKPTACVNSRFDTFTGKSAFYCNLVGLMCEIGSYRQQTAVQPSRLCTFPTSIALSEPRRAIKPNLVGEQSPVPLFTLNLFWDTVHLSVWTAAVAFVSALHSPAPFSLITLVN